MSNHYKPSPYGEAIHPWFNKPDTKYNADGVYKSGLAVGGEAAQAYKAEIDALALAGFETIMEEKGLKPADRKKWSVYYPYDVETDDEGVETGRIIFHYKQNATLRLKDGEVKKINIGLRDSQNEALKPNTPIFGGSTVCIMWKSRPVTIAGTKQAGVRLDFNMVQLIKQAEGRASSGGGFAKVEGGYVQSRGNDPDESEAPVDSSDEY